jgi:hypothetical protein
MDPSLAETLAALTRAKLNLDNAIVYEDACIKGTAGGSDITKANWVRRRAELEFMLAAKFVVFAVGAEDVGAVAQ